MAMGAEAEPVAAALGLERTEPPWHDHWPAVLWEGDGIHLVQAGVDDEHGVDLIGTQPATASAVLACEHFGPSLFVSAGTAGGFASRGGEIGKVYIAEGRVWYHGRNANLPGFDRVALGGYPCADFASRAPGLGLTPGVVTTGDRLDAPGHELDVMNELGTHAKEMEAAAVAWVASRRAVPFTAIKSITDIVDGPRATESEFLDHLHASVDALAAALTRFMASLQDDPGWLNAD